MINKIDNYNIKHHNTFRIDANAATWIEYTAPDDLPTIFSHLRGEKFMNIGQGSNMLFTCDYDGTILHSRILDLELSHSTEGDMIVRIGSGVVLDEVIEQLANAGVWGLENLSYIPGYAGSAAVQNVGAYGVEIKDFITAVDCYDIEQNKFVTLSNADCQFAYRDSIFKRKENKTRYVVTHITLLLPAGRGATLEYGGLRRQFAEGEMLTPLKVREVIIRQRRAKLPDVDEVGSAGSFFMNPVVSEEVYKKICSTTDGEVPHYEVDGGIKIPAAWMIDQCGFKGERIGAAQVWVHQPLVIVNADGTATAEDILQLENIIIEKVKSRFGVELHPEVDHIY